MGIKTVLNLEDDHAAVKKSGTLNKN